MRPYPKTLNMEWGSVIFMGLIAWMTQLVGIEWLMFPELGALSHDIFKRPLGSWAKAPLLLVLTPVLTATVGTALSTFMNIFVLSVVISVVSSILIIRLLKSPIAPSISAGLLPLVLGAHSWWYPPCIFFGVTLLAAFSVFQSRFISTKIKTFKIITNETTKELEVMKWFPAFLITFIIIALLSQVTGIRFLLYPPLVVIGYELFSNPNHCPWLKRLWVIPLACVLSAAIGVTVVSWAGITISATVIVMALCITLLKFLKLHAPPILAIGLLPMIISSPSFTFVAAVFIGTTILTLSFLLSQRFFYKTRSEMG